MNVRRLLFAILPLVLRAQPAAGLNEREVGLPFLRNYTPKESGGQAQNWAVTQDRRGIVYIGNNDGVLVYDGVKWRLVRVANRSGVRSLDVDADGRVYVGARGDFGYLTADDAGAPRYVSLLDQVPAGQREFKDVWRTIVTPQGVFFSSYQSLFRWKPETGIKVWGPARFRLAFRAGNSLYVQQVGADGGLLRLDGDKLQPVPGSERFAKQRIYCVVAEGASLMVGAAGEGWFLQQGDSFSPHPTEADGLLKDAQPYSCGEMPGGALVIGTIQSGAVLIARDGKLLRHLDMKAGLLDDFVTSTHVDREGGLWLALNSGITRVQAPSPLSFFDGHADLKGSTTAIARQGDTLYAGTSAGLYRLVPTATSEFARFEPVEGMGDRVGLRSLLPTEAGLLVGGEFGVNQLQGTRFTRVKTSRAVYDLTRSTRDPALVYVSGSSGLGLARKQGGTWSDGGKVPGITQVPRRLVETPSGLWLGTDFEGVLRVEGPLEAPVVTVFGPKAGLPTGWVYPARAAGRVVFLTEIGILKFDEATRHFSSDPVLAPMFADSSDKPSVLVEDGQGNLWAGTKTYGTVLRRQPDGSYHPDPAPLDRIPTTEIYAAHIDADGVAWAGTAESIARYNPAVAKDYRVKFPALVRRVAAPDSPTVYFGGAGIPGPLTLPHKSNSLRFEFAAPSFDDEARTEYRRLLDGFDSNWSSWSQETHRDYTNLPEGAYTFRVQARNLYGTASEQGSYALTVLAPWQRTWWGYALWLLSGAALVWGLVQWRLHLLAEQNRRLQKTVDERTAELREKNLKLVDLNKEKNEFLGIAAHDLKNPLGAIRGYAEMLEEDAADIPQEEIVDTAARIKKSANIMFDLVSNLLDVNRIEQGKMDLTLVPCDLWETVRQTVDGYRTRAAAKEIQLHFEDGTRAPLVMGDAAQLVQIMDNLVSNAVKYSPAGKNVYVRVHQVETGVRAEIRDEGPGISAEDRSRMFGQFARLSARPTAGEHSTGLGLAIVKRLVESMNGKVWCESELGKGATFVVELAAAVVEEPSRSGGA